MSSTEGILWFVKVHSQIYTWLEIYITREEMSDWELINSQYTEIRSSKDLAYHDVESTAKLSWSSLPRISDKILMCA